MPPFRADQGQNESSFVWVEFMKTLIMSQQGCLIFTVCDQYLSFLLLRAGGRDKNLAREYLFYLVFG